MEHKDKVRKRHNAASRKNPHALGCAQAVGVTLKDLPPRKA